MNLRSIPLPALAAILLVSALTLSAQTPLPSEFRHWHWSAPIAVGPDLTHEELVSVSVPVDVVGRAAPDLADLRVVDGEGRETPYILHARSGGTSDDWRTVPAVEPSFVDGLFSQVVAATGEQRRVHNAARLTIGGSEDFVTWVEVAASDDGRTWRVVRERAPIYNLRTAGMGVNTSVSYPDIVSRFARFRLLDGSRRYIVSGLELAARTVTDTELVSSGITLRASQEKDRTVWTSDTAQPRLRVAAVQFETGQPTFLRAIVVDHSINGSTWQRLTTGEIYRMFEQGQPRASLLVRVPERAAAHWRIVVYNRNDPPLPDLTPRLESIPRRVVFRAEAGRPYRLAYGNSRAAQPGYEMARLTDVASVDRARPVSLEAAQENSSYVDPAPWTERHPLLLWIALGLAVAALAALAVRTMQSA